MDADRLTFVSTFSTGEPDRPPAKVGVAATDIATGLYAHGAIMAALISRQQTGKGVWIDCNLFESQVHIFSHSQLVTFWREQAHILVFRLLAWRTSRPIISLQGRRQDGMEQPILL